MMRDRGVDAGSRTGRQLASYTSWTAGKEVPERGNGVKYQLGGTGPE